MNKVSFLFSVVLVVGFSFSMYPQAVEFDDAKFQANKLTKANMAFKPIPVEFAVSEQLDITGWG
ncbi:MAG: hypothetical protein ACO3AY_06970, partial [Chitinophagaceae bacterium]